MTTTPRKRGLGRGLDALLAGDRADAPSDLPTTLPLSQLRPGKYQPRTRMDPASLAELAESIKAQGIIQPILVRKGGADAQYEIIAGERRYRAAMQAGLSDVPVTIRDVPDRAALAIALIENIQREDLNPLEEAQGIARLIEEFKLTQDAAAQAVGRSRSAVANLLRLLQLPAPVRNLLNDGRIDMGHARALLALDGAKQIELGERAAAKGLSVRVTEALVRQALESKSTVARTKPTRSRDLQRLEEDLADRFGAKVEIAPAKKGGRLVIHYASNDHLNDLLDMMRK